MPAAPDDRGIAAEQPTMHNEKQAPHRVLNVEPDASQEEVHRAFRQLAKTHHPDVSNHPDATARFQEINDAYQAMIGRDASTDLNIDMNDLISFIAAEQERIRAQAPQRWAQLRKEAEDRRTGHSQGLRGKIRKTMEQITRLRPGR